MGIAVLLYEIFMSAFLLAVKIFFFVTPRSHPSNSFIMSVCKCKFVQKEMVSGRQIAFLKIPDGLQKISASLEDFRFAYLKSEINSSISEKAEF